MYLQLFVFELQQNKEIATWEIEWISNVVKIWISNAHKNLIWLSYRHFFFDKCRKSYKESCITFSYLRFKKKNFYEFLTRNNLQIFVIFPYFVIFWTLNAYKKKLWLTIFNIFHLPLKQYTRSLLLNFQAFLSNK